MQHRKVDRNAKQALNQFKYEMADELGLNQTNSISVDEKENFNTKKTNKKAKNKIKRY